jgi:hypothetical protein
MGIKREVKTVVKKVLAEEQSSSWTLLVECDACGKVGASREAAYDWRERDAAEEAAKKEAAGKGFAFLQAAIRSELVDPDCDSKEVGFGAGAPLALCEDCKWREPLFIFLKQYFLGHGERGGQNT